MLSRAMLGFYKNPLAEQKVRLYLVIDAYAWIHYVTQHFLQRIATNEIDIEKCTNGVLIK